jgi:hypothetical protein
MELDASWRESLVIEYYDTTHIVFIYFEPRWLVIITGRQNGPESVREFVLKKKYVGDEISASELLI